MRSAGGHFRHPTIVAYVAMTLLAAGLFACSGDGDPVVLPSSDIAPASESASEFAPRSDDPFDVVMSVLRSPRCSNCHPTDDRPRQTDLQTVHGLGVVRDATVQTCSSCHHDVNNEYSRVPGAPHWELAPASMGWIGLSDVELAEVLLDPAMNGDRSHEELIEHMTDDALVLWAWDPGEGREPPPVPHDEFVAALNAWFDAGAPIPTEGD